MAGIDMKYDFSSPEALERVWQRVSVAIEADRRRGGLRILDDEAGKELGDDTLELLSAAGDVYLQNPDSTL